MNEAERTQIESDRAKHQTELDRLLEMRKIGGFGGPNGTIEDFIDREQTAVLKLTHKIEQHDKTLKKFEGLPHPYVELSGGWWMKYYALRLAGKVLSRIPNFDSHLGNIERSVRAARLKVDRAAHLESRREMQDFGSSRGLNR